MPIFYSYYRDNIYDPKNPETHLNIIDISESFTYDLKLFKNPIIILYTFSSQAGAIPIFQTLHNNTDRRTRKVAKRSIYLVAIFVLLSSICGYVSIPYKTPKLFIYRSADGVLNSDWVMVIGKLGVLICLVFSFPSAYIYWRLSFFNFFTGTFEFSFKQ